ncbi:hypothetical protein Y032_0029g1962 [Ancylostoma ceylanicum]|uniref:Uncharacterized protein n=1 Tax=Ancylostoma ceylanicum TaxID=53326 RepID=A0A016USM1_9BILA|nr:hypothetical protein Y032_0029g1962 [Ancylostoma ceylanicum]
MQMTHVTRPMRRDLILDTGYITLSAQGLAIAYAYLRKQCLHVGGHLRRATTSGMDPHPHRHREEPFHMAELAKCALSNQLITSDWTKETWFRLPAKPIVVLLPEGFEYSTSAFTRLHQRSYSYVGPRDFKEEWFKGEISAIIFFSPTHSASAEDWFWPWTYIMRCVANGADLFCVPGPRDDANWAFGVDFLRDFCDEVKVQRPSLIPRIHDLLPKGNDLEAADLPFNTIEMGRAEHTGGYRESSARRFLNATVDHYRAHFVLLKFKKPEKPRRQQGGGDAPPTASVSHRPQEHAAPAPSGRQETSSGAPREPPRQEHRGGRDRSRDRRDPPHQRAPRAPARRRSYSPHRGYRDYRDRDYRGRHDDREHRPYRAASPYRRYPSRDRGRSPRRYSPYRRGNHRYEGYGRDYGRSRR